MSFNGLSTAEALKRRQSAGPNTISEKRSHPLLILLKKFWAPIPWMLEIIILIELVLGKRTEAWIILTLLIFNASLSFFQEDKAQKALRLLKKRLQVQARVLRDGQWNLIDAEKIVPDDLIQIRMGDIIPADVEILEGTLLIDQSALTGESLPQEIDTGKRGYASSIVQHGEALVKVIATGPHTYYGQTSEIVRTAIAPSHLQRTIGEITRYLVSFNILLILSVFIYSIHQNISLNDLIPFCLLLLVASVPVALPPTYTLATALGSLELSKLGVLVTHLSAIEEAAAMNVLCVDKTGTITQNALEVSDCFADAPYSKDDLFCLAGLASEEATQDPIDLAILKMAQNAKSTFDQAERLQFIPFDPDKKCSERIIRYLNQERRVQKGAPSALLPHRDVSKWSRDGSRVLAVTLDSKPVGVIALKDPPRTDSKQAIQDLKNLGLRVIMLTGDNATTARSIAEKVGIGPDDVIAEVFPKDKFQIIRDLQRKGSICGMTGDGVNDAPALKQAEVGIAVCNATDVAKASASLVLTQPGLTGIVQAIQSSRRIYHRMLTYTLNKIIKTLEIALLLSIGLCLIHNFIISQVLLVLVLFTNDFLTMSISTDHASFSQKPDRWNIKKLMEIGGIFALSTLVLSFSILAIVQQSLHLSLEKIQTVIFLILALTGQANVYLVRERHHFWNSHPSVWMLISSSIAIVGTIVFATLGILMAPISIDFVGALLAIVVLYYLFLNLIKVRLFQHLNLDP